MEIINTDQQQDHYHLICRAFMWEIINLNITYLRI
jgi:hypothetical protein